jgi:hypothetical protein
LRIEDCFALRLTLPHLPILNPQFSILNPALGTRSPENKSGDRKVAASCSTASCAYRALRRLVVMEVVAVMVLLAADWLRSASMATTWKL